MEVSGERHGEVRHRAGGGRLGLPRREDGRYETGYAVSITRRFAAQVLDLVAPRPGERLLDVACGIGARGADAPCRFTTVGSLRRS